MSEAERAVLVRVEGKVQGVGFRAFTAEQAAALGIRGWGVNREDGSVEAALHGHGGKLGELIGRLRSGPSGSEVGALDVRSTDRGRIGDAPDGAHTF